jgi:hypothetical protein
MNALAVENEKRQRKRIQTVALIHQSQLNTKNSLQRLLKQI